MIPRPLKSERAQFLVDNLDLPEAAQIEGARWEHFQLAHLECDDIFRIEVKSRQIAWSFLSAAEAVADGILTGRGSVFVSINLDEAKEKIRYANNIRLAFPKSMRPSLLTDNRLEVEFDNGARLISLPSTAPRGKAQMNVYLDEFAHVRDDGVIYTAALPMITKGDRRLRIGSSPMGAGGRFWEIYSESIRKYPGFSRKQSPWWETHSFCTNVRLARQLAPTIPTFERVEMFGNDRIKAIFANMPEEDFWQEYECVFVDETTAWISWELIKRNQQADLHYYHARSVDEAIGLVNVILDDIRNGMIEQVLCGGLDIGRKKDLTELVVLGRSTTGHLPIRLMVSLDRVPYDDQEQCFREIITRLPFTRVLIDQNGIGGQLAENLTRTGKAQGVYFTNSTKELWAVEARLQAERGNVPLPINRDLSYQIHSIKKTITTAKNNVFDTERNEKHHADKFWAWALGIWAANTPLPQPLAPEETQADSPRWNLSGAGGGRWRRG